LFAATVVAGILFIWGTTFNGSSLSTTKASAASEEFQGGATPEMLAFALNFHDASNFAVFGGHGVRNRGESVIRGNVGSTGVMTNVPGGSDVRGENYGQAKQDLKDALRAIAQLPCQDIADRELGDKTFTPGVYCLPSANLAGTMTVSGDNDPNSRFIFRIRGTLTTAEDSLINAERGAKATNVYIIADDNITISARNNLKANIISNGSVIVANGSTVSAKTIGVNGDVDIDTSSIGAGTGSVEICKALAPGDPIPPATPFTFTVSGLAAPVTVLAGSCSAPLDVAIGNATITETVRANTAVTSITVNPAERFVSQSLGLRQVVVAVPEGNANDQTVVTFTNQSTRTGTLEICKNGLDEDVTGMFQYTVQGLLGQIIAVPVGFCSGPITTTILQAPDTTFSAIVTEIARPNYRLEAAITFPSGRLNGIQFNAGFDQNGNPIPNTNGGYVSIVLIAGGGPAQQTTVNFFNRSLPGVVKVCKITADPTNIPVGTVFRFTVTGTAPSSPTSTTPGVPATVTVDVPAGPAAQNGFCQFAPGTWVVRTPVTVTETGLAPGQSLPGGLTFADTRVSRIRANPGPLVASSLLARTAVFPARNTTAEIEFTNFVFRPAILKVCKNAGPGVAIGTPFTFTFAPVDPLTTFPFDPAPMTVLAGSCQFANGPFPPVLSFGTMGTFNFNTQIIVTEGAAGSTVLTGVTSPTGGPVVPDLPGRRATLTLNQALLPNNFFNEIAFTNAAAAPPPSASSVRFDFDGDGMSDPVIFRPNNGTWWYGASSAAGQPRAVNFGIGTDRLVAADYDGDGYTDFAIYRNGEWHILSSRTGVYTGTVFGLAADIPQPGDYDGDGRADIAVYRPSDGTWYIRFSQSGTYGAGRFGLSIDQPVAADYDGDGRTDLAVYRGGVWYILGSSDGFRAFGFGLATDRPIPADYDGDHRVDPAVFRNGEWHILSSGHGYQVFQWGMAGDIPVPADYNGDGIADEAVYRPAGNVWHIMRSGSSSANGSGYISFQFGTNGDETLNY